MIIGLLFLKFNFDFQVPEDLVKTFLIQDWSFMAQVVVVIRSKAKSTSQDFQFLSWAL